MENQRRKEELSYFYEETKKEYDMFRKDSKEQDQKNKNRISDLDKLQNRLTQQNKQLQDRLDASEQKCMQDASFFFEEKDRFKEMLGDQNAIIDQQRNEIAELNQMMQDLKKTHSIELDDQKNNLEDQIADIKSELKKTTMKCLDLRSNLSSTEASLDKERSFALNTSKKLDALS